MPNEILRIQNSELDDDQYRAEHFLWDFKALNLIQ